MTSDGVVLIQNSIAQPRLESNAMSRPPSNITRKTKGRNTRGDKSLQHVAATRRSNKFHRVNRRILLKILSPRQNFVAATCCTKSNWLNFVRHVAATKFCRGDKILIHMPPNVEVFTPGDLLLQPIAAMSAYDLSLDCTHKVMCCRNVL